MIPVDLKLAYALGRAIRRRRMQVGLSQDGLAQLAKCHRNRVWYVEHGRDLVTMRRFASYSAALGVPMSELLRDAEQIMDAVSGATRAA